MILKNWEKNQKSHKFYSPGWGFPGIIEHVANPGHHEKEDFSILREVTNSVY